MLAVLAALVADGSPASASPAVQPASETGKVPAMGLKLLDASALACPGGATTWAPMVLPIEMAPPQGPPNTSLDPLHVKNMPDGSALWYRSLGSTRSGESLILDGEWTQDGRKTMPITRTGLRSGTYLLGALCATPGRERISYSFDARGNLVGEWFVVTFVWMDSQPEQGTFQFERQVTASGTEPTPEPPPATTAVEEPRQAGGGTGWPVWLAVAVALGLVVLTGAGLRRRRLESP